MPRLLYVPLSPEALAQICERADLERRRPQDEAALLLRGAQGTKVPCGSDGAETPTGDLNFSTQRVAQ